MFASRTVMGWLGVLVLAVTGCGGGDAQLPSDQQAVAEEIKALKGNYFIDKTAPDQGIFSVNLSGTAADDALVAKLEPLPKLTHLKLNGTKVTNAAAKSIKNMKNLVTLDIGNTKITQEVMASIKTTLPKAEIVWNVSDEKLSDSPAGDQRVE
jgi:hypothetical protein